MGCRAVKSTLLTHIHSSHGWSQGGDAVGPHLGARVICWAGLFHQQGDEMRASDHFQVTVILLDHMRKCREGITEHDGPCGMWKTLRQEITSELRRQNLAKLRKSAGTRRRTMCWNLFRNTWRIPESLFDDNACEEPSQQK